MNILFIAPVGQSEKANKEYARIIAACKKEKHTVTDLLQFKSKTPQERALIVTKQMKHIDAVVAESSTITIETSRFISMSLQFHIPTLLLYKVNNPESQVFETSRFLTLKKYTESTLDGLLDKFSKRVMKQRLLYRFNLMLSKEIGAYVMEKSRGQKVSKADYIRNLILEDMDGVS